jgi:uncharacterized membrane protein YczE
MMSDNPIQQINATRYDILWNMIRASAGLVCFGFGAYLTIQANCGVAPWDTLNLGIANTFGILYGSASIIVSLIIIFINIMLRESIGLGMVLDTMLVGKSVDFFNWLDLVPLQDSLITAIPLLLIGIIIEGMAQFLYMRAALGCGPRDAFLVGLKRRFSRIPIGAISIIMLAVATFIGWHLGGPIGIGTVICAFLTGPVMALDFHLVNFDSTSVRHQNLISSAHILAAGKVKM